MRRGLVAAWCVLAALAVAAPCARADMPYGTGGPAYHLAAGATPNDLSGDGNDWKFAATPEAGSPNAADPKELNGIRGASIDDPSAAAQTAWRTTTGRPDVTIAVLDSGIRWNDFDAMLDLRKKVRLNAGELPKPDTAGPQADPELACPTGGTPGTYDLNGDGAVTLADYACDSRVQFDSRRAGPTYPNDFSDLAARGKPMLTPQDIIISFSKPGSWAGAGQDNDHNGYVNDIAGWDFLDNDNDPYDDVQYSHGTGEAKDSSAEANNGGQSGSCPNCTVVPLRVGDSFVADVNRFAQATLYAVDNHVLVVQEALGALNKSKLAGDAVEYAYRHGVAIIASAADEAAQHHNWPSNYPHTIVVNSVNKYETLWFPSDSPPANRSYLQFNGCTNFGSHITVAIPSSSCSSNATGVGAGIAGLIYSAALNAKAAGKLSDLPASECQRVGGDACQLSVNEVRQLMASGTVSGAAQADDVNFTPSAAETTCPAPGCTDPNSLFAPVALNRPLLSTIPSTRSYPARRGFDLFYGYGRVNAQRGVAVAAGDGATSVRIPPEAEITSPDWYDQIDPSRPSLDVAGHVAAPRAAGGASGSTYTCRLEVAPGSQPNNDADFQLVSGGWCDGTARVGAHDGSLGSINLSTLKGRFPSGTDFTGAERDIQAPNFNGRPNPDAYGFTVRVVVTATEDGVTATGQDRRNFHLHRDQALLPGYPRQLPGDIESSPLLVDLDGDNRNEMILANSDGIVHAYRSDGSELPGWPVRSDPLALHTGGAAFTSEVSPDDSHGAFLGAPAAVDINGDGVPEVIAADAEGKVYVWDAAANLLWKREANPDYSGKPLTPFENVRQPNTGRTQHGFFASPVVADLDGDGKPEIVAAGMDRHVYAWHADGSAVNGFPVLVVDRSKVDSIDPTTHQVHFKSDSGADQQGPIVDTPAIADITGDHKAEIVVGTNEEYLQAQDGGLNAGNAPELGALSALLSPANTRIFAIQSTGEPGGPLNGASVQPNSHAFIAGWPARVGKIKAGLLPVVGEGITGNPVIAPLNCPSGGSGPKVGTIPDGGPGYIFNPDGKSCYGQTGGKDNVLQATFTAGTEKYDTPAIPAVGNPAFGNLGGASPSFVSPAAGAIRALDLGVNEYQGGQDFLSAWNTETGQFRPGFPTPVNDLQFLTGPSIADIDNVPGEEVIGGTASMDLAAVNGAGQPASLNWPKLTSDWMVATPLIGSFGTLDTASSATKVVIAGTRRGTLFAYSTPAAACSPSSWPRFHHDNANSGFYDRDAVAPGKPTNLQVSAITATFTAPGDDLMCGRAKEFQVVHSDSPITPGNFAQAEQLVPPAPAAVDPGSPQTVVIPQSTKRYVAVRAVDDQGNVGRPAVFDRAPQGAGGGGGSTGAGIGDIGTGAGGIGAGGGSCRDLSRPTAAIDSRHSALTHRLIALTGSARDRGCGAGGQGSLRSFRVALAQLAPGGCRFLDARGHLGSRHTCRRPTFLSGAGGRGAVNARAWSFRRAWSLPAGRYIVLVRSVDSAGNSSRPVTLRFTLR
jgi:Subtilase family/FG-GAP-like repeat